MPPPTPPAPLFQSAVSFAARAHRHQLRKDKVTPYFAHPVRVAFTVRNVFDCDDETALAIALLHDTIEDTTTDYDDLAHHFGSAVADGVAAVTKNMALPEPIREREYDDRLSRADWRCRLVKLADCYDNLSECDNGGNRADTIDKCRRALALAEQDLPHHPPTRRAADALRALANL